MLVSFLVIFLPILYDFFATVFDTLDFENVMIAFHYKEV